MPTTGTTAFGSAPTVSPEKSMVVGCAASPGRASAARPIAETTDAMMFLLFMTNLLHARESWKVGGGATTSTGRLGAAARRKTRTVWLLRLRRADSPDIRRRAPLAEAKRPRARRAAAGPPEGWSTG